MFQSHLIGDKKIGQRIIVFLLAIQFFGFFFDDNFFYFAALGIYVLYLSVRNQIVPTQINQWLFRTFLLFIGLTVFANITRIFDGSLLEFSNRNWKMVLTPVFCVMLVDAYYSLARFYEFRLKDGALTIIASIIAGTFAFIATHPEIWSLMLDFSFNRSRGLVRSNVNMGDDVYFFLACSLLGFSLWNDNPRFRKALWVISGLLFIYFFMLIVQGQSRGGWIGIIAGIGFVLVMGAFLKRFAVLGVLVLLITPILVFQGETIMKRLNYENSIQADIWKSIVETGSVDLAKIDPRNGRSTLIRLKMYENGLVLAANKPVFGYGEIVATEMVDLVPHKDNLLKMAHLHNLYLDVMVRMGIGMLLVYLMFMFVPIFVLFQLARKSKDDLRLHNFCMIWLAFSIYLVVENLTNLTFIRNDFGVRILYVLMSIYAFCLVEYSRRNKPADETLS